MLKTRIAAFGLALCLFTGAASALDANDIVMMVKNGVDDSVIVNMVQTQKLPHPLTAQEVMALNAGGASSYLLENLTRPDASLAAATTATVVTGSSAPTVTYVEPEPTIVTAQPSVIVTQPPTVYTYPYTYYSSPYPYYYNSYPRYHRYRSGPSFSIGFGFGGGNRWHGGPRHGGRWHGGRRW